jgi:hypothetical protein
MGAGGKRICGEGCSSHRKTSFPITLLGAFWFGLWMNKGWPGATGLLARLLHADGEYAYDAMQYEMTIWCLLFVAAMLVFGVRARPAWRRRK